MMLFIIQRTLTTTFFLILYECCFKCHESKSYLVLNFRLKLFVDRFVSIRRPLKSSNETMCLEI